MEPVSHDGEIRKDGPLSAEEEIELWRRCVSGDDDARERLILAHRPLVFWLAKRFYVAPSSLPDLIQEGMTALVCAVDAYDSNRGARFVTYAYYRVRGRMANFLARVEARAPLPIEECDADVEPEEADRLEWVVVLREGLEQLPPREAEVVEALVLNGRRAKEYADERRVDVSYVYRLQRKALARLRAWLGGEEATNRS